MDSPTFRLLVEPLDLGLNVRAISLDLTEEGAEDPVIGPDAARIWTAAIPALAGSDVWMLDFVSHLDRIEEFCDSHDIARRRAAPKCTVVAGLDAERLRALITRFESETFGIRAGGSGAAGDAEIEHDLSGRGMDAYQGAYRRYTMCAICDFENGSMTVLSEALSSSEILRRLRPALEPLAARVERPN